MVNESKLKSRKFIVWLTWLVLVFVVAAVVLVCCVKSLIEASSAVEMFKAIIQDFFYISMLYLGVNVGQKAAFAFGDKRQQEEDKKENAVIPEGELQ